MTFTKSSQGGGGIFAHGWTHYLEVSNNHVFGNGGTLSGGITIGQMETVDPTLVGATNSSVAQPLNLNHHTHVHNNSVTFNAAYGDELNSTTPSSAGGVTFCTGSDYYLFDYNWVCGNLSTGDGGGVAQHGFMWNGDIEHNSIIFNQSINPTLTTYGGGLIVQGSAPDGAACENALIDFDCPPALSDGSGPGLRINANLFQGNTAEEGSGGVALEQVSVNSEAGTGAIRKRRRAIKVDQGVLASGPIRSRTLDDKAAAVGSQRRVDALIEDDRVVLDVAIPHEPVLRNATTVTRAQIAANPVVVE